MGDIRTRLVSLSLSTSLLVVVGLLGGCGDNVPRATGTGGAGAAGSGGGGAGAAGSGTGGSGGEGGLAGGGGLGGLGGGTGGIAGQGGVGGAIVPCYATTFTTPASNATILTVADDVDHSCADGFTYIVNINSGAPDNTPVSLYSGTTILQASTVMSGTASFSVRLASGSTAQSLAIQYPGTATCNVSTMVTVNCPDNPPLCTVTAPTISPTHPALNGVLAPAGDRVSSSVSMYQVAFKVQTSAEDGQPVTLAIDNQATPTDVKTLLATASNGVATFTATLPADGTYEALASCVNKNGVTGMSAKGTYPVDTTAPNLTLNSPMSGQFVVGANINVCGQTSSADAAGLPAALGTAQSNLCVTVGSSATPSCAPMTAVNTSSCVSIPCPGAGAFDLTVILRDAAGNPTSQALTGLTCVSSLPSVQIIAPASDAPTFTNPAKHILAATAPTGIKDKDAGTAGAQVDVVACTDTAGTAVLKVGHKGDAILSQLGGSVATAAATPGDNCPAGLQNVVRFSSVTLPESNENADGTLSAATELTVTVTSSTNAQAVGTSQPDDVWVDTTAPALALASPPDLCGQFIQSSSSVTQDLSYTADGRLVVLDVSNGTTTTTYDTPAFMNLVATFPNVLFTQGQNDVSVTETDPAGNAVVLGSCKVNVGAAPQVTFVTPATGALLCAAGAPATACKNNMDNDGATLGWQGSIAVTVATAAGPVSGGTVTFTVGGNALGSATLDAAGNAQLNAVTLPEGVQTIVATTSDIPGAGVGANSVTVTVDTLPPDAPTDLNVSLVHRRETSMQVTWTAPADAGGGNVKAYQIRYANVPIDASNFDTVGVTTPVTYQAPQPSDPQQLDGVSPVTPLYIENNYYFAVRAVDGTGLTSSILTNDAGTCDCLSHHCCAAHFNQTVIPSTAGINENLGFSLSADGDVSNDSFSDILAGTLSAGRAYLFLGNASGTFGAPSVVFTGTSTGFGTGVGQIGDIDNDGIGDIAIADSSTGSKIYIYKGRSSWPMTLADTQADYVITGDAGYTNSLFGFAIAKLGDFTGDGVDDFAFSARAYAGGVGRIVVIAGKTGFQSINLPDTTNAITIDGDPALGRSFLGYRLLGIGHFFGVTAGTTMIVSGVGAPTSTPANRGNVYAFHGQTGTAGTISITSADASVTGPANGTRIGVAITNLGPMLNGQRGVGIGNPVDNVDIPGGHGGAYLMSGTPATGPFAVNQIAYVSGESAGGGVLIGGGLPGRDASVSLIGDSTPDLVMAGEIGGFLTIADGAKIVAKGTGVDLATKAEVLVPLPSGWNSAEAAGSIMKDANGDGYADFCLGSQVQPGAILVIW